MSVQNAIEVEGDPTALYRLFGADGTLLYVGVTRDIPSRFAQHEVYKPWWPRVARKTMTWYGSRNEALTAELAAIADEGPLFNIKGVSSEEDIVPRTGRRRNWSVNAWRAEAWLSGPGKADEVPRPARRSARRPRLAPRMAALPPPVVVAPPPPPPPPPKIVRQKTEKELLAEQRLATVRAQGKINRLRGTPALALGLLVQSRVTGVDHPEVNPLANGTWEGVSLRFPPSR